MAEGMRVGWLRGTVIAAMLATAAHALAAAPATTLTDDLKEGVIRDIRVLLSDRSRIAANSAVRTGGNRTDFSKGVFSPCELCKSDPTRAPLWQIKARKVTRDEVEQRINYNDAWMEFYGVPVAYMPFFSHPDPTAKRQSGFLQPTLSLSSKLGFGAQLPFYWVTSESSDVTIAPIFYTGALPVFAGEYRQRVTNGLIQVDGSATYGSEGRDTNSEDP